MNTWVFLVLMLWAVICRRLNAAVTAKSPPVYITVLIRSELSQHSITVSDGPPIYSIIVLIRSELSQHSITVSDGLNLH